MALEAVQQVLAILTADATVTALVAGRIFPLTRPQDMAVPSITLRRVVLTPTNYLGGDGGLDNVRVQVDSLDVTYAGARAVADAVRNAMRSAGVVMTNEIDGQPEILPVGMADQIIQEFEVWS